MEANMDLHGGALENDWVEKACALQDPIKVQAFITELLSIAGLDVVAWYSRLENLYFIRRSSVPAEATVLYEILRILGEKQSLIKGQTISRAAGQRAEDLHAASARVQFS